MQEEVSYDHSARYAGPPPGTRIAADRGRRRARGEVPARQSLDHQAGDAEDKIVRGGESFVLDHPGLSLVTALLGPALLIVQPGRSPAAHEFRAAA